MKFLLTSNGAANPTIAKAILELTGLAAKEIKLAFVPTAANIMPGNKDWVINDLRNFQGQGYGFVDIVDIAALPKEIWLLRLRAANVICFGGGDEQYLAGVMTKSGLREMILELFKDRLYLGISAGSMVAGRFLPDELLSLVYPDNNFSGELESSLGLVDCHFIPHLNSWSFPHIRKENLEKVKDKLPFPLYSTDDETALKIVDGKIEIAGEGEAIKL